jgi:flagellar biosynthesis/type III secretory pathway protein FliH
MENWKFDKNDISKNDLPMSVEVNGVTYYSSLKMAKVHNAWYDIGVTDGKSMANATLTRSDAQYSNEYMKGYEDGKDEGYKAAQVEGVARGHSDADIARTQEQWYQLGYEAGKKEEYHPIDSDNDHYQTGYNHGKSIGYNHGKTDAMGEAYNITITPDFIKGYNQAKGELEHQIQKKYKEGYADGKTDGYKESYHEATIEKVAQFNKGYEIGSYTASKEEAYQKGYEAGKKNHSPYIAVPVSEYPNPSSVDYEHGYNDGYEQCKYDEISKINLNTEPVEQT